MKKMFALLKPHFSDTAWILNKALETCQTGGYSDIYGLVLNTY